jgi:hypothetical protein
MEFLRNILRNHSVYSVPSPRNAPIKANYANDAASRKIRARQNQYLYMSDKIGAVGFIGWLGLCVWRHKKRVPPL